MATTKSKDKTGLSSEERKKLEKEEYMLVAKKLMHYR